MSDQENNPKPAPAEPGPPDSAAQPAGDADDAQAKSKKNVMVSNDLLQAMAEAEACVSSPGRRPDPAELEVDVSTELETPAETGAEEKAFDPNAVDREPAPSPPPPSPRELELKMQILELRSQLRDKDKEIEQRLKELKQDKDQATHLQKQLDAFRARVQKEKADWFNYGHEPLLKELLAAIDNLERALAHATAAPEAKGILDGVEMTLRLFFSILKKFGVEPIVSLGQPFDPNLHQAMTQIEDREAPPNTVIQEHQKGYRLKDRLLRPAMVVVSKKPLASEPAPGAQEAPNPAADAAKSDD